MQPNANRSGPSPIGQIPALPSDRISYQDSHDRCVMACSACPWATCLVPLSESIVDVLIGSAT